MHENLEGLRALCLDDLSELSPFQVRTRFERHLYGLLFECSKGVFGSSPRGLSKTHVRHFCQQMKLDGQITPPNVGRCSQLLNMISELYENFTRLCDTSNWSDDGQDPRINSCRSDILRLCDYIAANFQKPSPTRPVTSL
jgi:hypothetical protein